jgi:hypothetical protein
MRRKISRERSSSWARLTDVVPIGTSTDKGSSGFRWNRQYGHRRRDAARAR